MTRTKLNHLLFPALLALGAFSCGEPEELQPAAVTAQQGLTKSGGGVRGDFDYCNDNTCVAGEGDCDNNAHCGGEANLVCGSKNGLRFGLARTVDVCWPAHCQNGSQDGDEVGVDLGGSCDSCGGTNGAFNYCSAACPCIGGEGDCDGNSECQSGFVCGNDNGPRFGFGGTTDACWPAHCQNGSQDGDETGVDFGGACGGACGGVNGDYDFCSPTCKCSEQQGDCDTDADCATGTYCSNNKGSRFGLRSNVGVCIRNGCYSLSGVFAFCEPWCPCVQGEGDCDVNEDCMAGLYCDTTRQVTINGSKVHVCQPNP